MGHARRHGVRTRSAGGPRAGWTLEAVRARKNPARTRAPAVVWTVLAPHPTPPAAHSPTPTRERRPAAATRSTPDLSAAMHRLHGVGRIADSINTTVPDLGRDFVGQQARGLEVAHQPWLKTHPRHPARAFATWCACDGADFRAVCHARPTMPPFTSNNL